MNHTILIKAVRALVLFERHCTPRALPQDDYYAILQGASSKGVAISFLIVFNDTPRPFLQDCGDCPEPFWGLLRRYASRNDN
jgi:hypothetical protein